MSQPRGWALGTVLGILQARGHKVWEPSAQPNPALPSEPQPAATGLRTRSLSAAGGGGAPRPHHSARPHHHQGPTEQEGVPGHLCRRAGQFQLRVCPGLHVPCHPSPGALLGPGPESDQNPGILVWGKSPPLSWRRAEQGERGPTKLGPPCRALVFPLPDPHQVVGGTVGE